MVEAEEETDGEIGALRRKERLEGMSVLTKVCYKLLALRLITHSMSIALAVCFSCQINSLVRREATCISCIVQGPQSRRPCADACR